MHFAAGTTITVRSGNENGHYQVEQCVYRTEILNSTTRVIRTKCIPCISIASECSATRSPQIDVA